jgi:hypothetical protein
MTVAIWAACAKEQIQKSIANETAENVSINESLGSLLGYYCSNKVYQSAIHRKAFQWSSRECKNKPYKEGRSQDANFVESKRLPGSERQPFYVVHFCF